MFSNFERVFIQLLTYATKHCWYGQASNLVCLSAHGWMKLLVCAIEGFPDFFDVCSFVKYSSLRPKTYSELNKIYKAIVGACTCYFMPL